MKTYAFPVVIEKDEDGFFVQCPDLQGCYSQGDSYEEAVKNIKEAMWLVLKDMEECGEEIPKPKVRRAPIVEVTV